MAVAANVMAGTMTSSPGPMLSVASAVCRAAVPLQTATAAAAPTHAANARSNSSTLGPVVSQSARSTAATDSTSASWMLWRA